MAKNLGTTVENQFIQGLITEATGLNFPEKAVIETWNTRYHKTGSVKRRLGYDSETSTVVTVASTEDGVSKSFLWKEAGSNSNMAFLVQQTGNKVLFFESDVSGNFNGGLKSFSINLDTYKTTAGVGRTEFREASFAFGLGRLFINHPYCEPLYVKYNETTDTIAVTQYEIKIRDFAGVVDGLEGDERPTTLSNAHKYNLYNQSWYQNTVWIGKAWTVNPITHFFNLRGAYPSNADVWWYYKDSEDRFNPNLVSVFNFGNSRSVKGHYIYNAFDVNREEKTGITNITNDTSEGHRPSAIGFYAGRVWYAAVDHPDYSNILYYTQIIEGDNEIGVCHQKNDPTNESLSDLLDTDGGTVKISGIGKIIALFPAGSSLLVFGSEGVWAVSGGQGVGFVATDFSVNKVSGVNINTPSSLVNVEGMPVWWNLDGIWGLTQNNTGDYGVQSLSHDTIKTFLDDEVPVSNRPFVQGAFNPLEKTVQWLWKSEAAYNVSEAYQYDRIMELNLSTGAFYPFKWTLTDQYFSSIVCLTNFSIDFENLEDVTETNGDLVIDSLGATVTANNVLETTFASSKFKYITNVPDPITINAVTSAGLIFSEESDTTYYDFVKRYGAATKDYDSYFTSGAKVHGEGHRSGVVEYITVFANNVTDGSAKIQAKWDWSNSGDSGKWSSEQQVYSANRANRDVSRKRLLIRGSGPALQLHYKSEAGKPFDIIGWTSLEGIDASP